ncbi:MAG: prolipoprotein diacylglyceryl transferase [Patescibacteria group bacterium]
MFFDASPSRVLFAIGPVEISWYGALGSCAIAIGYGVIHFLNRHTVGARVITVGKLDWVMAVIFFAGVVGARALFVFYHFDYFREVPFEMVAVWKGGWVWQGGLLGGGIALVLLSWLKRVDGLRFADLCAPALAFAQSIGRWGNYFQQEAYGRPTTVPWAIPIDSAHRVTGFDSAVTFHPTFLYESVADLGLGALLIILLLRKKHTAPGTIAVLYLLLYSLLRFSIEFLRIDIVPVWAGLRLSQWISLGLIILAVSALLHLRKKKV